MNEPNDYHWTDSDIAEAHRLWVETKMTKRQIGAVFGKAMNAIGALRNRLGWPARACDLKYTTHGKDKPQEWKALIVAKRRARAEAAREKSELKLAVKAKRIEEATPMFVKIIDIKDHQCRNIIGEPRNGIMCGRQIFSGSYCKHHSIINYKPSTYNGSTQRSYVGK